MDWYENRHLLEPGQIFEISDGDKVRLSHRVPGDGTDWYADVWYGDAFLDDDFTIHPSELRTKLAPAPMANGGLV